ncbi:uncharacterized protein LOC123301000 isoform X2 [Chrysoperla carnea]|uniref:uncharacterized protein LOC123301000 isoform X2 n=1 Tax=Chrysoperla carnea TaxID=189513 RepID=UPI001D0693BE|nr:uncharacterized protein LOC123301000 isoform X2 [Chrysoperla carnea]
MRLPHQVAPVCRRHYSSCCSIMSDKDAGFCSGEDDIDVDDVHSPTDASEDSIEVKVTPISPRNKNKRKCAEPRKVPLNEVGPLKKRIRRDITTTPTSIENQNPFRPWSSSDNNNDPNIVPYHPVYGYKPPPLIAQDEPLSLVKVEKRSKKIDEPQVSTSIASIRPKDFARFPTEDYHRVPPHPGVIPPRHQSTTPQNVPEPTKFTTQQQKLSSQQQKEHRNYKNMTRERRIEANARERTRVHTISAAFDTLRRAIPAYSHNQKLSKLSVLRIACSYILTLSRVAGTDYSADQSEPPLANCVDLVSRTIQTEGKLRKKKDD